MKLTIVYDNELYKKDIGLKAAWGFSCVIETKDDTILFDTGGNGKILLGNMEKLGIDPGTISKIVISHEHWDHNGGLKALGSLGSDIELYRLSSARLGPNLHVISVEEPQEISENVFSTGRIKGFIDEQSLILKGKKGLYILVGCSHPGVEKILNSATQYSNIVGLIGGFHGFKNLSVLNDLNVICACHCTSAKREIQRMFPTTSFDGGVGKVIELDVGP